MIHCPRCGTANAPTNHNCVACGAGLAYGAPGYGQPPAPAGYGGQAQPGVGVPGGYPGGTPGPNPMPQQGAMPQPGMPHGGMQQPGMPQPGMPQPGMPPTGSGMQQGAPVPYAIPGGYPPAPAANPGYYPGSAPPAATPSPVVSRASQPDRVSSTGSKIVGFLVSFETNDQGDFWVLRSGQLRVGRKDSADGLAVAIDHPTVSSSHAVLTLDPDAQLYQVEDLRSANGTVLNGRPIAGQGAREIRDGDHVRFGGFSATLKLLG